MRFTVTQGGKNKESTVRLHAWAELSGLFKVRGEGRGVAVM
jgi:hypothetical protein